MSAAFACYLNPGGLPLLSLDVSSATQDTDNEELKDTFLTQLSEKDIPKIQALYVNLKVRR